MINFNDFIEEDYTFLNKVTISKDIFELMNNYIDIYKKWSEHYKSKYNILKLEMKEREDKDRDFVNKLTNANEEINDYKETIKNLNLQIYELEQKINGTIIIEEPAEESKNNIDDPWDEVLYDEDGEIIPNKKNIDLINSDIKKLDNESKDFKNIKIKQNNEQRSIEAKNKVKKAVSKLKSQGKEISINAIMAITKQSKPTIRKYLKLMIT